MRRIVVVPTVLAVSLIGSARAQQTAGKAVEQSNVNDMGFETTGATAEKVKAKILELEKEKVPFILKGGATQADHVDLSTADSVLLIGGDGEVHSKADHMALWRNNVLNQQNEIQYDHEIHVYDNGNIAAETYLSVTQMTRDGKEFVHFGRLTDVWVKTPDGRFILEVHAGSGRGR